MIVMNNQISSNSTILYLLHSLDIILYNCFVIFQGLCKLGSFGGADASAKSMADGSTETLSKACRKYDLALTNIPTVS